MGKFRLIIPKIEIEFEADSLDHAFDLVDSGTVDVIGEMHEKRDIYEINRKKITHDITVIQNRENYLDPLNRQWICSCNKIIHTETEAVEHGKVYNIV